MKKPGDEGQPRTDGVPVDTLAEMIVREKLQAGDRLPSERRLADALGLSRGKVREMLKVWESQGRIVIRRGAGCFLQRNGSSGKGVLDVLESQMTVTDIFEVRRGLEVTAVRLAAVRATTEDVDQLRQLWEQMRASSDESRMEGTTRFTHMDRAFHRAIHEATKNTLYPVLFDTLSGVFEEVSWKASRRGGARQHALWYHQKIVQAISQSQPDLAAAVMELHLSDAEELLRAALREERADRDQ